MFFFKKISVPNNITNIYDSAFSGCKSLGDVEFEDGEETITLGCNGYNPLFNDCPLDEVYIGRKLSFTSSPFKENKSLRSVEITDAETEIYNNEFYGCSNLKSIKIGNGVKKIGDYAFSGCSSMGSYTSGTEVKSIGKEAFSDCTALTSFTSLAATPPTCGSQALDDINKWECKLLVPGESINNYRAADQWKEFFFIESGVEDVIADSQDYSNCPKEIYNLYGIKIGDTTENLAPGMYIVRQGKSCEKIVIQ